MSPRVLKRLHVPGFSSSFQRNRQKFQSGALLKTNMWVLPGWLVCMFLCVCRSASKWELQKLKSEKDMGEQQQLFEGEELSSFSRPARKMNLDFLSEDFHSAGLPRILYPLSMPPRVAVFFFISTKWAKAAWSLVETKQVSFARLACLYVLVCVVALQNENFEGKNRRRPWVNRNSFFRRRRTNFVLWTFWERHGKDPHLWEGCLFPVKLLIFCLRKEVGATFVEGCRLRFCWTARPPTQMIRNFFSPLGLAGLWPWSAIDSQGKTSFNQGLSGHKKPSKIETPFNYRIFGIFFCQQAKWPLFSWVPRWGTLKQRERVSKISFETGLVYISAVFTYCCWSSF